MMRTRRTCSQRTSARDGNATLVTVVTLAVFAGLACVIALVAEPSPQPAPALAVDAPPVATVPPAVPAPESVVPTPISPVHREANAAPVVSARPVEVAEAVQTPAQSNSEPTPQMQVNAHLSAGEYGLATEVARTIADAEQRSVLLRQIADVQMQAGEFDAALSAIRRIPLPDVRRTARSDRTTRQTLAGGGSLADFTELINLITMETSGPWAPDDPEKTISPFTTGVHVDPHGQLALLSREDKQGRLASLGLSARQADLNEDMAQSSSLRLVSLHRLEREIARRLENGQPVLNTMQHLAGLSQIRYVFVDKQSGDVIIGGPAEAWEYDASGRPVGVDSGRPMLHLDDLVTVMRIFSPTGSNVFNCLIVPRQEGLKQLKEVVDRSNARGSLRPGSGVRNFAEKCQEALGPQDAVFGGVPTDSRVARVMLEADYKMKLVGIDKLDGGSIPSYFDLLDAKTIQQNPPTLDAMRWWLTMKYEAVLHSPDETVFEIQGSSVRCQSENERVTATGQRIHTGKADPTNQAFADQFTAGYAQLAEREPVFADLQNVFDLALVAALIRHEGLLAYPAGYGVFAANGRYAPARYVPPTTVETAVNHKVYNGRDVIVQVAGGVQADLASVLKDTAVYRVAERLGNLAHRGQVPTLPDGRWWWDAK